jgi:murein L,D-transpeptidase YcbB/YkuD
LAALAAILIWSALAAAPATAKVPTATPASIRARLDAPGSALLVGSRVSVHADVRLFYEVRGWEPAFSQPAVQRALLARIHGAPNDGLDADAVGADRAVRIARALDAARRAGFPALVAARLADLDIALADAFLRYGDALLGRNVDPALLYGAQWQPARRPGHPLSALHVALAQPRPAHAVVAALDRFAPAHPEYSALRARLASLHHLLSTGWQPLRRPDSVAVGTRSVWAPAFRERLVALGFASPGAADPYGIDSTLIQGVHDFQMARGLPATGDPDSTTVRALNETPDDLIATLALNMARWRWLPDDLGVRHLLVNLPAYSIQVRERADGAAQTVLEMPAVIGMASAGTWTTPVMSDRIHQVVFQPPWYVPPSIAGAVIFPAARADSGTTLTARGYETYLNGTRVDPATLDWETVTPGQLRFVQRPGPGNAMGRVKFVMPNPYFILIHDTNKPWSFRSEQRAFSYGCIHAGDPLSLAQYVLGSCGALGPAETEAAYRTWASRTVQVTQPIPVHLTYFTAWPGADGSIRYLPDVYGHDPVLARALGLAPVEVDKSEASTKG